MMADSVEHAITYWVAFQKFHSPTLGGFAMLSHWLPFLLFSTLSGALADRFDPRRLVQIGMGLFMFGKKAGKIPHLVAGVALMTCPYFITNLIAMVSVCIILALAPFFMPET